jgi:hypothetical protein
MVPTSQPVDGFPFEQGDAKYLACHPRPSADRLAVGLINLTDLGLARDGRARPDDSELAQLYTDCGLSLRDGARHYGLSARAVGGWLIAAGIDRRPPGATPSPATTTTLSPCTGRAGRPQR